MRRPYCSLRKLSLFVFISCCSQFSIGQISPANIGFETGTFTGWSGTTGQCCPANFPNSGLDTSRHVITTGNFYDQHSNGLIPVVAPNSVYSVRLGNENNSAESEALDYSFIVPSDSLVLKMHFAVLLENGLHPVPKQTRFGYSVQSASSQLTGCTSVNVIAGESTPDTILDNDLEIYFWQSRMVNLIGHIGESISVRFETNDCGPGGHFGYAYVDCELIDASLANSGECNPDGSVSINVQPGLNGTWHNGIIADSINISNPVTNGDYFLELNAGYECSFKIPFATDQLLPLIDFTADNFCHGNYSFNNFSQYSNNSSLSWNFGDGTSTQDFSPIHHYSLHGNYTVILSVDQPNNCHQSDSITITLQPENEISIEANGNCIYELILLEPESAISTVPLTSYSWYIDELFHDNKKQTVAVFNVPGPHNIMLITENNDGCTDTSQTILEIPDEICSGSDQLIYIPNAFTPNGDGKNEKFKIEEDEFVKNVELIIFDRFGKIINTTGEWDGTSEGKSCQEGIYIYKVSYKLNNRNHLINGTIALIR